LVVNVDQEAAVLARVPTFAKLDPARLKLLAFTSRALRFAPGDMLIRAGDPSDSAFVILEGTVEFLEDEALAERLYEARPWLRAITGEGDVRLAIFRVAHGSAWFWTMAANLREREQERVRF